MTAPDATIETEAVEQDAEAEQADPETTEQPDEGRHGAEGKLRKRAQAAEAERDALAATVTALRQAEVDRLVGAAGVSAAGFRAAGVDLADLLTEDGAVDGTKVATAVEEASTRLGLARPRPGVHVPGISDSPAPSTGPGWSEVLGAR